jgi:hypothetical protein
MNRLRHDFRFPRELTTAAAALLLLCGSAFNASADPEARFRGTGKADPIRITNVARKPADTKGASAVVFDLAWDHSWRAAWDVSAEQTGGSGPLKLESWDAAWVFAKFRRPGDDGWSHATLSPSAADHSVPAGAKLDVGPTDDGKRGAGVFVYRAAAGSGANDFKGVTLRWLNEADGVADPKAAEIKVSAVQMVYVPQCAFWLGDGSTAAVAGQFSTGDTDQPFRVEGEGAITLGGESKQNLGNHDGLGMHRAEDFASGGTQTLPARFPKGYAAFYCMRHEITEGEYVEFLNAHSFQKQVDLTGEGTRWRLGKPDAAAGSPIFADLGGIKIAVSGIPGSGDKPAKATVYESATPHVACRCMRWSDCAAYAAWAGLRPMTELEYEKACRGPLRPVPDEYAWGTAGLAGAADHKSPKEAPLGARDGYALQNPGKPDECAVWKGDNGPDASRGNAVWDGAVRRVSKGGTPANDAIKGPVRAAIFATPDSGRPAAGASYWGILELSGNLWERVVNVGQASGRRFAGKHGEWPVPVGPEQWGAGFGCRGGSVNAWPGKNDTQALRVSNREMASHTSAVAREWTMGHSGNKHMGFRCVRTAKIVRLPDGLPAPKTAQRSTTTKGERNPTDGAPVVRKGPSGYDQWKVSIENVTLAPRDAKTAVVKFDISWSNSWRDKNNHDAVWMFFKARPRDKADWQHARLAADKVLNPAGYGQAEGTALDFIVPDGDDGFNGVFVRRAAVGEGPLAARRVEAILDLPFGAGLPTPPKRPTAGLPRHVRPSVEDVARSEAGHNGTDLKGVSIRAFGIRMVYVPEGPFCLGSGGVEVGGFYQHTDGAQQTQPYRVTGPGAIATGRQPGKLWVRRYGGRLQDGGEIPASFPNGYAAFYCMIHHIVPAEYAAFLSTLTAAEAEGRYPSVGDKPHGPGVGRSGTAPNYTYTYVAGAARQGPGHQGLSWADGAAFAAWAGLRPMTELELEKAVRGPREPVPDEVGPSYWGIGGFGGWDWDAVKGDCQCERPVTVSNAAGRKFKGTHGLGTLALPADWPRDDALGAGVRSTYYSPGHSLDLQRARLSDRFLATSVDPERHPLHKWRGVRTAPKGATN